MTETTRAAVLRIVLEAEEEIAWAESMRGGAVAPTRLNVLRKLVGGREFDIEAVRDDHVAIWPWLRAPAWARELLAAKGAADSARRFILFVPRSMPAEAIKFIGIPEAIGRRGDAVEAECGDGSLLVAYGGGHA